MSRPKKSAVDLSSIGPELASLRAIAGDDMMQDAFAIVRERLGLNAEKLALLIIRVVNPDEVIGQVEEATIRNVKPETLRTAKSRGDFPREINGLADPSKA